MRIDIDTCEEILITITRNKNKKPADGIRCILGNLHARGAYRRRTGLQDMMQKNFEGFATNSGFLAAQKREKLTKDFVKDAGGIWKPSTSNASARR